MRSAVSRSGAATAVSTTGPASVRVRDEQLGGREARDHLRAVGRDDDLLLDPGGGVAVLGGAVRLERDDHALLELDRVLERVEPADDGPFVEEQPDAVAELEAEAL